MATESVVITYPDGQGARLLNSFSLGADYDTRKQEGESKQQFFHRMVKDFVRRMIVRGESEGAAEGARNTATAAALSEMPIT